MLKKIILGGLALFCIYGALNYSGFCFKKMRYLSDDEKIRMAIAVVNKIGGRHYTGEGPVKYMETIPYESVDVFLRENPDCCTVVPFAGFKNVTGLAWPPTFWERFCGQYNSAVRIRYTRRYIEWPIDKHKRIGSGQRREEFLIGDYHIDNCGEGTQHTALSEIAKFYTIQCQ